MILLGAFFITSFLNSKSFGNISFFLAFFSLLAFIKSKKQNFFVICQITFHFAPNANDQLKNLTPTLGKGATPLRPIEAQSVVNIAGMKYLVVPHPDPGKSFRGHNRLLH